MKALDPRKSVVFLDFDNTVTAVDVIDDLITRFSKNEDWKELEESWQKGEIGSRACLVGQLKGVEIAKKDLDNYLSRIKLDPWFKKLLRLLKSRKVKTVVLSDNFDYMISRILRHKGIKKLAVYCNKMSLTGKKMKLSFPFSHKKCPICAHCKKKNLLANASAGNIIIYVGDGRSDICPARHAHLIFAKESLLKYCRQNKLAHLPFKGLKDVYLYLKRSFV